MFVKISVKHTHIELVQVYMPTTNHDNKIEKLYEEISDILHQEGKGQVECYSDERLQQHHRRRISR
jgi:hypothetical protein